MAAFFLGQRAALAEAQRPVSCFDCPSGPRPLDSRTLCGLWNAGVSELASGADPGFVGSRSLAPSQQGLLVLGAPVGSAPFVAAQLRALADSPAHAAFALGGFQASCLFGFLLLFCCVAMGDCLAPCLPQLSTLLVRPFAFRTPVLLNFSVRSGSLQQNPVLKATTALSNTTLRNSPRPKRGLLQKRFPRWCVKAEPASADATFEERLGERQLSRKGQESRSGSNENGTSRARARAKRRTKDAASSLHRPELGVGALLPEAGFNERRATSALTTPAMPASRRVTGPVPPGS